MIRLIPCILLTVFIGCNNNIYISGRILFPDDQPLRKGEVVFQSETYITKSVLNQSGGFELKIPPGSYNVYILGAAEQDIIFVPPKNEPDTKKYLSLIAPSFGSATTTPLHCEIRKSTKQNFIVQYP
jgi:hypothetical protein